MSRSDYKKLYEGYVDNTTPLLPIGYKIDSSQPVKVNSPTKVSVPTLPTKVSVPTLPTKVSAPTLPTKVSVSTKNK